MSRMTTLKSVCRWLAAALVLLTALPACSSKASSQEAPDFTLLNLNGDEVHLSDYRGKVVLLNFFATYCPPCRMEMPEFVDLQREYGPKGFKVIAVSVDEDPQQVLPPFIQRMGLNFPVLMATSKVIADYGNIYALPQTFVIDRQQRIVRHFTGMITRSMVEPLIKDVLGLNEGGTEAKGRKPPTEEGKQGAR